MPKYIQAKDNIIALIIWSILAVILAVFVLISVLYQIATAATISILSTLIAVVLIFLFFSCKNLYFYNKILVKGHKATGQFVNRKVKTMIVNSKKMYKLVYKFQNTNDIECYGNIDHLNYRQASTLASMNTFPILVLGSKAILAMTVRELQEQYHTQQKSKDPSIQ